MSSADAEVLPKLVATLARGLELEAQVIEGVLAGDGGRAWIEELERLAPQRAEWLLETLAAHYRVAHTRLGRRAIERNVLASVDGDFAREHQILPLMRHPGRLVYATLTPDDPLQSEAVRHRVSGKSEPMLVLASELTAALGQHYPGGSPAGSPASLQLRGGRSTVTVSRRNLGKGYSRDDGPTVRFVDDVLRKCVDLGASDIHFEPYENHVRVRLRVDGDLMQVAELAANQRAAVVTRVKIISGMDIAESRKPQDGAIKDLLIADRPVDFRVSSLPTVHGEKLVLRILDKSNLQVDMTQLGFEKTQLEAFENAISAPYGMVLVTGPTGSGKTTTLYSAIHALNNEKTNTMTAEDPVEYSLEGINQVQVRPDIGFSFAEALRSFLRQDPDVILVGEIRDLETAEIALKAALTGHMVLSTLHTNSATETLSRLLDMGVEPFNIVAALSCVTAQRLMRRNCEACSELDPEVTPEVLIDLGVHPTHAATLKPQRGRGCNACGGTGSKGRIAVHEVLVLSDALKRMVVQNKSTLEIKHWAMKEEGMRSLRQSALLKLAQGKVSVREVIKTTAPDRR